ncbi:MAG TPA: extracellular solute-binding protein [Ktedonobacterales bacterium]|nr:extracellular solute-binding protein [Ktedonobacterales bacterium]
MGVALLLAAMLLAGCGTTPVAHGPVTLTYWYTEGTSAAPAITQLIATFERQNPGIRIAARAVDLASSYGQFVAAARAGHPPDAIRIAASWTVGLASAGYLLDLDPTRGDVADWLPVPLTYATWHGRIYALPQETDLLALYYNKALFQAAHLSAPPATWASFDSDNRKLTTASQFGWSFEGSAYMAQAFIYGFGGGLIDTTTAPPKVVINRAASVAGLNALKRELAYAPPVNFTTGYTDAVDSFKAGASAMLLDGSWDYATILTGSAFTTSANLGVAAVPFDPACCDAATPRAVAGGQSYAVAASGAHPAEAARFVAFLASESSQMAIAAQNHTLPARLSVYTDPASGADTALGAFAPLLATQVARPLLASGDAIYAPQSGFDDELRALLTGSEDAQTAADHMARQFTQLLGSG